MSPALVELVLRSAAGRLVRSARLARNPRYAIGVVIGLLYFGWWLRHTLRMRAEAGNMHWGMGVAPPEGFLAGAHVAGALFLAGILTSAWIFARGRAVLRLTDAEVHVLLAAPLPRRDVLQYALLKAQPGILVGSTLMTLMIGGGPRLATWPGYWALLTLIDLHVKACALWKARQQDRPRRSAITRLAAVWAGIAVFWVAAVASLAGAWNAFSAAASAHPAVRGDVVRSALGAAGLELAHGPVRMILAPFLWATGTLFGDGSMPVAFGGTALLLVLHHEWVVRSKARFEEATLESALRSGQAGSATAGALARRPMRRRRGQAFRLGPVGAPGVAVYWKNLRYVFQQPLPRTIGLGALVFVAAALVFGYAGAPRLAVGLGLAFGGSGAAFLGILGGAVFRNDLRADLSHLELLRAWPVPPWQLVLAEVLAPATATVVLLGGALGLLLATDSAVRLAEVFGRGDFSGWILGPDAAAFWNVPGPVLPWCLALGALPLGASLAVLSSALQNVITLLFPGWVPAAAKPGRFEPGAFGQRLLFFSALMILLALALLPAALVVTIVLGVQHLAGLALTAFELPVLGVLAALVPAAEAALLVAWGARLWTRLDPAEVLEES